MRSAQQTKALIRNVARERGVSAQLVLQNYMLERFLERVSVSRFRGDFVIKGGFLIASLVGLGSRTTMDLDASIRHQPVSEGSVAGMVRQIVAIDLHDGVAFTLQDIREIREGAEYPGFRVNLTANYPPMAVPLKLDITTGDAITPGEVVHRHPLLLEKRSIDVMAYSTETVLAEKLETIVSRGDQNTRMRDFYDVYLLTKLREQPVDADVLRQALQNTAEKRGTAEVLKRYRPIVEATRSSPAMLRLWGNYRREFPFAADVSFDDVCDAVAQTLDALNAA